MTAAAVQASAAAPDPAVPQARLAASAVVCDVACLAFAGWTLLCNAVVVAGGAAAHLAWATLGAGVAMALWLFGMLRGGRRARLRAFFDDAPASVPAQAAERDTQPAAALRALLLCAGIAIAVRFRVRGDLRELCVFALAYLALGYLAIARSRPLGSVSTAAPSRFDAGMLCALAVAYLALTLAAHVPDPDDTLYVNMAVSVADFPERALLSSDTLHGIAGAPFKVAAYRVQSLELLSGLIDYATGIPAIYLCHFLVPGLAALLTPLALARLLRLLDPQRWIWAVFATLLLLIFDGGGGPGSYHKFAFIRLFQGKAIFASVMLPMIMACGIRFGLRPNARTFVMLAAAQIAALGTTATALWAAPVAATLAVVSVLMPRPSALPAIAAGVLSSAYVLAWGVYLKLRMPGRVPAESGDLVTAASASESVPHLLSKAYAMVLGHGTHLALMVAIALCAWPLCRTALARRVALVFPLGFFLFLGNPWLTGFVSRLTTESIHWRVLWLLPIPWLAGLALSAVLPDAQDGRPALRFGLYAVLTLGLVGYLALRRPTLVHARLGVPALKLDPTGYRVARALLRQVPPRHFVLAPLRVSMIVPMLDGYSYPLATKPRYIPVGEDDRRLRVLLNRAVDLLGVHVDPTWLAEKLAEYHVDAVAFAQGPRKRRQVLEALEQAGFQPVAQTDGHEIWTHAVLLPGAARAATAALAEPHPRAGPAREVLTLKSDRNGLTNRSSGQPSFSTPWK